MYFLVVVACFFEFAEGGVFGEEGEGEGHGLLCWGSAWL